MESEKESWNLHRMVNEPKNCQKRVDHNVTVSLLLFLKKELMNTPELAWTASAQEATVVDVAVI